jgi:hypothetical protein
MKHISILSLCLLIATISSAQNAGINDPSPTAKLTVKGTEFRLNRAPSYAQLGLTLNIDSRNFLIQDGNEPFERDMSSGTEFIYRKSMRFVNEVYISGPGIINFIILPNFNLGTASLNSSNHSGKISGYLISD